MEDNIYDYLVMSIGLVVSRYRVAESVMANSREFEKAFQRYVKAKVMLRGKLKMAAVALDVPSPTIYAELENRGVNMDEFDTICC